MEAFTLVASSGTHGIKFIPQGMKCVVHGVIIVAKSLMRGGGPSLLLRQVVRDALCILIAHSLMVNSTQAQGIWYVAASLLESPYCVDEVSIHHYYGK